MNTTILISMLAISVAAASPLLLAALGELVVERSGVLNLGIEGIMLVGALAAVAATLGSGSVVVGILGAIVAGMLLGLNHFFLFRFGAALLLCGILLLLSLRRQCGARSACCQRQTHRCPTNRQHDGPYLHRKHPSSRMDIGHRESDG